jgi:hypothetical protein
MTSIGNGAEFFWPDLLDAVDVNGTLLRVCVEGGTREQNLQLRKLLKRNEGIKWTKERRNHIVQKLFGLADLSLPSLCTIEIVQCLRPHYELIPYFKLMSIINLVADQRSKQNDESRD